MTAFFSKKDLERLAGPRAYQRGVASVPAVDSLGTSGAEITATVYGSEPWQVRLDRRPAGLDFSCDCPRGMAGEFCRHCVAVGLVYLDGPVAKTRSAEFAAAQREIAGLRRLLGILDREDLVALLLDCANDDHDLRRHLTARVDELVTPGADVNDTELRLADVRGAQGGGSADQKASPMSSAAWISGRCRTKARPRRVRRRRRCPQRPSLRRRARR